MGPTNSDLKAELHNPKKLPMVRQLRPGGDESAWQLKEKEKLRVEPRVIRVHGGNPRTRFNKSFVAFAGPVSANTC